MTLYWKVTARIPLMLLLLATTSALPAQSTTPPTDAERRIVWNLENGMARYDGVAITYNFKLLAEKGWTSPEQLASTVAAHFSGVVSTGLEREGEHVLLRITTAGDRANHQAYLDVLDAHGDTMGAHPRSYHTFQ